MSPPPASPPPAPLLPPGSGEQINKFFAKLWGSAHGRFAALAVTAGATLVGSAWWQALFGTCADRVDWESKALGAFLIGSGVAVFSVFEWRATKPAATVNTTGYALTISEGTTFEEVIDVLADINRINIVLGEGFTADLRAAVLKPKQLAFDTLPELLRALRPLGQSTPLPPYDVTETDGHLELRVIE